VFVLALHFQAILETRLGGFLSHQDVADLLQIHLPEAEADDVVSRWLTPLASVMRGLLEERVPVRSMAAIVECLREGLRTHQSVVSIVENTRCHEAVRDELPGVMWRTRYFHLTPRTESMLARRLKEPSGEPILAIEPEVTQEFLAVVRIAVAELPPDSGPVAVLVRTPEIRPHVRRLVELEFPHLPVVTEREVYDWMRERVVGTLDEVDGGRA
jgi:flagellar biosynthesis protein FlhA